MAVLHTRMVTKLTFIVIKFSHFHEFLFCGNKLIVKLNYFIKHSFAQIVGLGHRTLSNLDLRYRTFGMFCVPLSIASFANGNRSQN